MPTKRHQDLVDLRHPTDKKVVRAISSVEDQYLMSCLRTTPRGESQTMSCHRPRMASKPLMEKRRRARINHSLAQLKALVVDPGANTTERSRQAKLEKADILELTVRHLHDMKRQQTLLPDRKRKKFEIGYSECAREVELFLSNLISLDPDVRQRLKDHLGRRLRDFGNNRDDDAASPQREASDEDEPSPSSSDSASLIPTDAEDSSDSSSALNKMLKCYAGKRATIPSEGEEADDFRPKRSKQTRPGTTEEMPFSCHSVTSTTGCKSSDSNHPSGPVASRGDVATQRSDRNFPIVVGPPALPVKNCLGRRPGAPIQLTNPPSPRGAISAKKHTADVPAFRQRQKSSGCISPTLSEDEDIGRTRRHDSDPTSRQRRKTDGSNRPGCVSPTGSEGEDNTVGQARRHDSDPIPLLPRRLANGDWALVLPASLMAAKEVVSHPFSAFKLVVPNNHSETGGQSPHSSSSTVSDTSYDEFCSRSDGERIGHSSPDSSTHQVVWRPW